VIVGPPLTLHYRWAMFAFGAEADKDWHADLVASDPEHTGRLTPSRGDSYFEHI